MALLYGLEVQGVRLQIGVTYQLSDIFTVYTYEDPSYETFDRTNGVMTFGDVEFYFRAPHVPTGQRAETGFAAYSDWVTWGGAIQIENGTAMVGGRFFGEGGPWPFTLDDITVTFSQAFATAMNGSFFAFELFDSLLGRQSFTRNYGYINEITRSGSITFTDYYAFQGGNFVSPPGNVIPTFLNDGFVGIGTTVLFTPQNDNIDFNALTDSQRSAAASITIYQAFNGQDVVQLPDTQNYVLRPFVEWSDSQTFYAGGGSDIVTGGNGNNRIDGGSGNDDIFGMRGDDILLGGVGNDNIGGGLGADTILGGAGDDVLWGASGTTPTADSFGDASSDTIRGESGNDRIYGHGGSDRLEGGAGDDTVEGGSGNDFALFSEQMSQYTITPINGLITVRVSGPDGTDTLTEVENLRFPDVTLMWQTWTRAYSFTLGTLAIAGAGDFNRDGTGDVLVHHPESGHVSTWLMRNGQFNGSGAVGVLSGTWQLIGTGDFNGDGVSDVLLRNTATGEVNTWIVRNGQWSESGAVGVLTGGWQFAGTGDFNRDGTTDVLLRHANTGEVNTWTVRNGQWAASGAVGLLTGGWQFTGIGDFNGDDTADVLLHNVNSNEVNAWIVGNGQWAASTAAGVLSGEWVVKGTGDFNGDGTDDVLLHNLAAGTNNEVASWLLRNGSWFASRSIGSQDSAAPAPAIGDFNNDGRSDLFWRESEFQAAEWLLSA